VCFFLKVWLIDKQWVGGLGWCVHCSFNLWKASFHFSYTTSRVKLFEVRQCQAPTTIVLTKKTCPNAYVAKYPPFKFQIFCHFLKKSIYQSFGPITLLPTKMQWKGTRPFYHPPVVFIVGCASKKRGTPLQRSRQWKHLLKRVSKLHKKFLDENSPSFVL
jgi:hypothetical protein